MAKYNQFTRLSFKGLNPKVTN